MREHALRLARVVPHPVAVRALIDLDAVPFPGDQIVAAFGALHVVRAPLGFRRGLLDGRALLAQQLGVPSGEILLLVSAGLVGHRPQGVEGGFTVSVSPPGRAAAPRAPAGPASWAGARGEAWRRRRAAGRHAACPASPAPAGPASCAGAPPRSSPSPSPTAR